MNQHISTKSESERQDEWSDSKVKPAPDSKPPRYDKRRKHYEEGDPDLDKKDKDLSMKDAAFEEIVCRLALQHRGILPDYSDVFSIKSSIEGDVSDPSFWPRLAKATFSRIDSRYRKARSHRIVPSADGRSFEQTELLPSRQVGSGNWPIWEKEPPLYPAHITSADHDILLREASKIIDKKVLAYDSDIAFRKALDETIWSYDSGKYQSKMDAPSYLALLNRLSKANLDLIKDTYIPHQDVKTSYEVFNPENYWGKPADSHIDSGVSKEEKWRKLFEYGGVYEHDEDEPYMKGFFNPNL